MKLIITEEQLRMIIENEEYINSIKELINTFDPNNIEMAFQIMEGLEIKENIILKEYNSLFNVFKLKPSKDNLFKIVNTTIKHIEEFESVPDDLFKLPNLNDLYLRDIGNLDNLETFNGNLDIELSLNKIIPNLTKVGGFLSISGVVESLPNLTFVGRGLFLQRSNIKYLPMLSEVGGGLDLHFSEIKSLPKLESVGGGLDLHFSKIKSLPKLESVGGGLDLENTPLSKTTTEEELRNKIDVKGKIYL